MSVIEIAGTCFLVGIGAMLLARAVPSSQTLNAVSLVLVCASPILAVGALVSRLTGGG